MGAKSQVEETQAGAFRLKAGIGMWDEVVHWWCGLKGASPDEDFDTLAAASCQSRFTDTMATHLWAIANLQRDEKYREPETLVMAYIQLLYRQRAPNTTVPGAINVLRAVQDMEFVEPIVSRKLWRMAKYSLLGDDDGRRTLGGWETLQLISEF